MEGPRFPTKVFEHFTKQELQDFLELLHDALEVETDQDIKRVLLKTRNLIPFDRAIGGLVRIDDHATVQDFPMIINASYPEEWLTLYRKKGYEDIDPVLLSVAGSVRTQVWKHTYRQVHSAKQNHFIEEAKSFGLVNGITVGRGEPRLGLASFFSFAGEHPDTNSKSRYAGMLEYLGHHLHRALIKHAGPRAEALHALTARERTVLGWLRLGKTNWEISRILGVTERTVRFHIESIFNKLDVTSRTQAVAQAFETGILTSA